MSGNIETIVREAFPSTPWESSVQDYLTRWAEVLLRIGLLSWSPISLTEENADPFYFARRKTAPPDDGLFHIECVMLLPPPDFADVEDSADREQCYEDWLTSAMSVVETIEQVITAAEATA